MNDETAELVIRRILVALDASSHSLAALEEAANLAASMEAELMGLFIEDINLIRLASLPFARQISYPSGAEESLDPGRLERELKVRGEHARKALAAAAERAQRPWSFRTVRGEITAEILTAAEPADVVFWGKAGWSPPQPRFLGSAALGIPAGAPGALLLAQHGIIHTGERALAVYDGSQCSLQALKTAMHLAATRGHHLTVFLLADASEAADRLEHEVRRMANHLLKRLRIHRLYQPDAHRLAEAVQSEGAGLLVLGCSGPFTPPEVIRELLREIRNPILLVR